MILKVLLITARSITFEISEGGIYNTETVYDLYLNGIYVKQTDKIITSMFGLHPMKKYHLEVQKDNQVLGSLDFETEYEFVTLNVWEFGARGDGVTEDTAFIQAAIMACPPQGRVLIPKGIYLIRSLFLKSHIRIELEEGAELRADTERFHYPILPGIIQSYDEKDEYNLGTWEGNPLSIFAGIITGIHVEDVLLYGEGFINGNASKSNWWNNPKHKNGAFRPRILFLNHCNHIIVQGLHMENSPAWVIHPYFSENLKFYNLTIVNPSDSPNTDGLNPESCANVDILGIHFSLGDDCIAVKSGKIYMGRKYKIPSRNIHIRQCLMENGHGAVTMGSEMSGGIYDVLVEECIFQNTDRGLRIKTRRGRGKDAILDQIQFKNIKMDHVKTPFVVNCFYFCDPDGETEYVQSRDCLPIDERTPEVKRLIFENIVCDNCHVAGAYFDGLPEMKIESIVMKNIKINYTNNPIADVPAMSQGVRACTKKGIYANNVERLVLDNVVIEGAEGENFILQNVSKSSCL